MKSLSAIIILTISVILLYGCKENEELLTNPLDEILSESVSIPLLPISSQITTSIREEISSSERNIFLSFYTKELYSPAGSKILSSFSIENNTIQIELKEIKISEMGAAISTPASATFNLGSLSNVNYHLKITINDKEVIGLITVTDESFELKIQPNNLLSCQRGNLLRIPKNIIWGQSESIQQIPYKLFLDSLRILGAKEPNLKPGDYSYFEVDSQGGFNTHSVLGMSYGEYFLFTFEGNTLITRRLVKRFAKRYLDSIYIQLSGGRGEMYYSTVLKNEP